jgi:hypothetical protein
VTLRAEVRAELARATPEQQTKGPPLRPFRYRGDRTRTCNPRFWSQIRAGLRGAEPAWLGDFGLLQSAQII